MHTRPRPWKPSGVSSNEKKVRTLQYLGYLCFKSLSASCRRGIRSPFRRPLAASNTFAIMSLTAFVLLAVLASPALAQAPTVSLLIDLPGFASNGTLNLRSTLSAVSTRKGQAFHFGSTYETYYQDASYHANLYNTFFNHMVAENSCKWQSTEPSPNVTSLTGCKAVQSFATSHGDSFRGHNTFWHAQTPVSGVLCSHHGSH
jgi:hypothetical protein